LNGFSALPIWLKVLPAALAALCKGRIPGRWVRAGGVSSSRSSGGVKNGSSGGRCSTMGNEETEGYERNEGVGAFAFVGKCSVDEASSTAMVGTAKPFCGDSPVELPRDRPPAAKTAARAVFCRLMNPGTDSEDPRGTGVLGLSGDGFITCNLRGPMDSR
jgi:hypothetical protein